MPSNTLTSIIVLGHNKLEYTRLCVESILRHTNSPFELILVDNGSTDGTAKYFNSIAGAKVIKNRTDRGFIKGYNQGVEITKGNYILFLDSGTIVTEHWLENLLACLESDPSIGIVGPRSNYANSEQSAKLNYTSVEELHRLAAEFNGQGPERWYDVDSIASFCMLVRREVIDKVGLFNKRSGMGRYEDANFCSRARAAGYRSVCAGNTFIHRFDGQSLTGDRFQGDNAGKGRQEAPNKGREVSERGELTRLFHQGLVDYADGRYARALQALQELAKKLPYSAYVKHAFGLTLMMLGKFNEAKALLAHALLQRSDNASLLLAYGDCLTALGELNDAEKHYGRVVELGSHQTSARMGLAVVKKIKGQPELLKFINNLEALVTLKTRLVRDRNEHLSITYITANHIVADGSKVHFEHIHRLIGRGHNINVIAHRLHQDRIDVHTEATTTPSNNALSDSIPPESDVIITAGWPQMQDLVKIEHAAHAYLAQYDRSLFEKGGEEGEHYFLPAVKRLADMS
ncbi:MAG TPA: glycosyltransferase, partial [Anaerolineae bacterium]|nr:glycosyltransferase [Anaerolineae bacterium]